MRNSFSSRDAKSLDALQHVKHVVGVAQTDVAPDEMLTVFLDEENAASRAKIAQWSRESTIPVTVKIVGKIAF